MITNVILPNRFINCIVLNSGDKSGFIITEFFERFVIIVTLIKDENSFCIQFQLFQQDMVTCCRISKPNYFRNCLININNSMYFNTSFALSIFLFSANTPFVLKFFTYRSESPVLPASDIILGSISEISYPKTF